jgi:hypothetical protein
MPSRPPNAVEKPILAAPPAIRYTASPRPHSKNAGARRPPWHIHTRGSFDHARSVRPRRPGHPRPAARPGDAPRLPGGPALRPCQYEKVFKEEGLGAAAGYWIQRENQFLVDFTFIKKLRHAVLVSNVAADADGLHTPIMKSIVTVDAGLTVEDWLSARPRYPNGKTLDHPFQHAGPFLELLRACLVALREIHALGIVHCDIKADNICLPYTPYPFRPEPGERVRIDFERLRLIDFAFAVTPERPLECPLPILPVAPYQSNLLKQALGSDRAGRKNGKLAAQSLDWRADLYSLGFFLAERILNEGLTQPRGAGGLAALEGAHRLVKQLRGSTTNAGPASCPMTG